MSRVRIAGPRALLDAVLDTLQKLELVHIAAPPVASSPAAAPSGGMSAARAARIVDDAQAALSLIGPGSGQRGAADEAPQALPQAWHRAHRTRARLSTLAAQVEALEEERAQLQRYSDFFAAFGPLADPEQRFPGGSAFYLLLRADADQAADELQRSLKAAVAEPFELISRPLPTGELAVVLLVGAPASDAVARLLSDSRVHELPAPQGLGETNLLRALPALRARLQALPVELAQRQAERAQMAAELRKGLERLLAQARDIEALLRARAKVVQGRFLFIIEGWLPAPALPRLRQQLERRFKGEVVVELVASEPWARADTPVALANPRLFQPFELITRSLPLPRYGSIDPTPFVAVFFPMFFGLMLGDAGYGLVLALMALALRLKSASASRGRALAAMAGACAAFTVVFGLLFGEFFGSLGRTLGLRAWAFNREESLLPFMVFTVGLGAMHVLLGLVLALVGAWRQGRRREAAGRGIAIAMISLSGLALLAAFKVLPTALFTPAVVAVLVAFPVLVALEGVVAVVELLSAFGHILSYVRIMAIGTASLMLAVVANQMVGALGSVVVGVLFALLFHIVNFAIGLFSPTIHALRLHYVEFFGKFFSPGGAAYRPLSHWRQEHGAGAG